MGFTPEQLRTYSYISNATLAVNGLLKELYERREEVETPASERDDIASWIVDLESKFIDLNRLERQFIDEPDRLRPPSQEAVDAVVELARQVDAAIEADARTRNLLGLAREIVSLVNETKLARAAAAPDTGAQRDAAGEGSSKLGKSMFSTAGGGAGGKVGGAAGAGASGVPPFEPPPGARPAASLRDLLLIREANRALIDKINGNLGSALGRKKSTDPSAADNGKPAILIFVPQKIAPKWVPKGQMIPSHLIANGVYCPIDVIEGSKFEDYSLVVDFGGGQQGRVSWSDLQKAPPLSPPQLELRDRLRGWSERISPGAQLSVSSADQGGWYGTLACFAKHEKTGKIGIVTNSHVAGKTGQEIRFASANGRRIATTKATIEQIADEARFRNLVDADKTYYRADCAFAELSTDIDATMDIDFRAPVISSGGALQMLSMGEPLPLDLNTMGPVGRRVIAAGRTRSFQRGTIVAFAYEWYDDDDEASYFTDYLIVGDDPDQFSAPGDSGKLILTDEPEPRPVALLWGGWQEDLSNEKEQQDWTYAIDINFVLEILGVRLLR